MAKMKKDHESEIETIKKSVDATIRGSEAESLRRQMEIREKYIIDIKLSHAEEIEYYLNELDSCQEDYNMAVDKLDRVAQDRENMRQILEKLK